MKQPIWTKEEKIAVRGLLGVVTMHGMIAGNPDLARCCTKADPENAAAIGAAIASAAMVADCMMELFFGEGPGA